MTTQNIKLQPLLKTLRNVTFKSPKCTDLLTAREFAMAFDMSAADLAALRQLKIGPSYFTHGHRVFYALMDLLPWGFDLRDPVDGDEAHDDDDADEDEADDQDDE
jgi:hypothetical protein